MDRHTCKLCFRRFHNGRALGGHMRSHVMAASAAAFHSPLLSRQPQSPPLSLASTSSTEMDDDKPSAQQPPTPCVVREGTKKRLDDSPGLFSGGGRAVARGGESSVVQDGESDTESSPRFAVSRRRSKRARRRRALPPPPAVAAPADDPEQPAKSSVSDATPEEDVAMSLVMLSRDSWTRSSRSGRGGPASSEAEQNNDDGGGGVGADADHHEHDDVARPPRGGRHHQCGVCRKVFRSYQALGGHRASIKKGKGGCVPVPVPTLAAPPSSKAHRRAENGGPAAVHECPFCFRVFESGQALGGHKRAHMPYASAAATGAPAAPPTPSPRKPAAKCGDSSGSFDLNVPAAATDDDFELSAVYDTEFGGASRQ